MQNAFVLEHCTRKTIQKVYISTATKKISSCYAHGSPSVVTTAMVALGSRNHNGRYDRPGTDYRHGRATDVVAATVTLP